MSASIGNLALKLSVDSGSLVSGLGKVGAQIGSFVSDTGSKLASIGSGIMSGLGAFGLAVSGAKQLMDVLSKPIGAAAQLEDMHISFGVMLKDAEAAKKLIGDLQAFADVTPFEDADVIGPAKQLLAFGVEAGKILPTLNVLGNIAAGVGVPMDRLTLIFGQVKAAGRLMGQDLLQLTSAGVPIIGELAKHFGVAEADVRQLVETGQVGFADFGQAMQGMATGSGIFAGLMERRSESVSGKWSTLVSGVGRVMTQLGESLIAGFDVRGIIDGLSRFVGWFQANVGPYIRPTIDAIASGFRQLFSMWAAGWAFWSEVWTQFGKPAFEQLSAWVGQLLPQGANLGDMWLGAAETIATGVSYVVDTFRVLFNLVDRGVAGMVGAFEVVAGAINDGIVKPFKEALAGLFKTVESVLGPLASVLGDKFKGLLGSLKGALGSLGFGSGAAGVAQFFEGVRARLAAGLGPAVPPPALNLGGDIFGGGGGGKKEKEKEEKENTKAMPHTPPLLERGTRETESFIAKFISGGKAFKADDAAKKQREEIKKLLERISAKLDKPAPIAQVSIS